MFKKNEKKIWGNLKNLKEMFATLSVKKYVTSIQGIQVLTRNPESNNSTHSNK